MFRLARFREANDTLADRVVLLDEVDAPAAHAAAALRFGADGKLYATFDDGGNPVVAGDLGSFNGKILRMNADGSTPDDQAGATPVFSYEYRSPRGLDWNPTTGMLWIADGDGEGAGRLSAIAAADGARKRGVIRATYRLPAALAVSALAFYRSNLIPAFRDNLLIASDEGRQILRIRFDAQDETRIERIEHLLQDRVGGVRAVACGSDGAIYFGSAHEVGRLVLEANRMVTPRTGAR